MKKKTRLRWKKGSRKWLQKWEPSLVAQGLPELIIA